MTGTTRFTQNKTADELTVIFKEVLDDLIPMKHVNPNTFIQLYNKSIKVSVAVEEVTKRSDTGNEVVNSWLENKEIFAKSKRL